MIINDVDWKLIMYWKYNISLNGLWGVCVILKVFLKIWEVDLYVISINKKVKYYYVKFFCVVFLIIILILLGF